MVTLPNGVWANSFLEVKYDTEYNTIMHIRPLYNNYC